MEIPAKRWGLLCVGVVALMSVGTIAVKSLAVRAAPTRASIPPLVGAASRAVRLSKGYRATVTVATGTSGVSVETDAVGVRHGATMRMYLRVTTIGQLGSPPLVSELVNTGRHICERQETQTTWQCQSPSGSASALLQLGPDHTLATFVAMGHIVQGRDTLVGKQKCHTFTTTRPTLGGTVHGTLNTAVGTNLPVRETITTTVTPAQTRIKTTTHVVATWNHWNDRGLRIPAVPAS